MSGYKHGVFIYEQATGIVPPVRVDSALPVIFGTAPVHTLDGTAPVNEPRLIFSYPEFVRTFGSVPEGESEHSYTLSEAARVYLAIYGVAPVVFVNVFDPAKHTTGNLPDVAKVTRADIIGGVDADTLQRTGLELVEEIFPRFRLAPGQLLAPGFSTEPAVAVTLGAKSTGINGLFRATGIFDIPASVTRYTDVPAYINDNNLTDPNLIAFYGMPVYNDAPQWGSSHLAGVIGRRDAGNEGIPYWSPSNSRLLATGLHHAGTELRLTNTEAQYLNGNGIFTALNFVGGMVAWGDRTAAYPGITDPKDTFIPIRRMFNFIGNTLVLTAWQMLDAPLRRRLISSVVDTFNVWLNGLRAREFILGGAVVFQEDENPTTDLMDGIAKFHVYVSPPPPARQIDFILEYDPQYLKTLFGSE